MLCSGEDDITGSKDGKKETMAQAETPAANLPGGGMLEEWRRLWRHLIRRPGRRRWGRGLSPRSRSVIREPAEHSKRVSSREATGRCLGVELLKAVLILRFCLPEQLFLILSSLQCCEKTVSNVAPRVEHRHGQLEKCFIAHLG